MTGRGAALLLIVAAVGCGAGDPPPSDPAPLTRLTVDRTYLRDAHGRYVFFHGVNVSGGTKVAEMIVNPDGTQTATYMNRPFPIAKADEEFERLRQTGFNSIRLLLVWEAIQPDDPYHFDSKYLGYVRTLVQKAGAHGIYVLLDMHQDMFSRWLFVKYNSHPEIGAPGTAENALSVLVPPKGGDYDDRVQGDGAPKWVVQACLPEKNLDSPWWGTPRIISGLNAQEIANLSALYKQLAGTSTVSTTWMDEFLAATPGFFPVTETSDMLPFTMWGLSEALSLDQARCYACLFAGDKVFPAVRKDGKDLKTYLQDAYAASWGEVAAQVADLPNVMGYDIINEPGGNYLTLAAAAGFVRAGGVDGAHSTLVSLLGPTSGDEAYKALVALKVLPPDSKPETLKAFGLDQVDVLAVLGMNNGFDATFLQPLYEKAGAAILARDPGAVIFIENTMNVSSLLGGAGGLGGQFEVAMTHPRGLKQVVFAPHWYPDIYPFPGFNVSPRTFTVEEMRYRDWQPNLETARALSVHSLGNIPVVFGEFGTYWNFNGIEASRLDGYAVSGAVLNDFYEAFERMFQSQMLWCYSYENSYTTGDGWNREDFSIFDPKHEQRGQLAWSRPNVRALAGKPVGTHFWSDFHWFDPQKGIPDARREFEVRYQSKETGAPTEIAVPQLQYPEGFYVWLSDGECTWDPQTVTLYHRPSEDAPGFEHFVRILPPDPQRDASGWRYFIKGDQVVERY